MTSLIQKTHLYKIRYISLFFGLCNHCSAVWSKEEQMFAKAVSVLVYLKYITFNEHASNKIIILQDMHTLHITMSTYFYDKVKISYVHSLWTCK